MGGVDDPRRHPAHCDNAGCERAAFAKISGAGYGVRGLPNPDSRRFSARATDGRSFGSLRRGCRDTCSRRSLRHGVVSRCAEVERNRHSRSAWRSKGSVGPYGDAAISKYAPPRFVYRGCPLPGRGAGREHSVVRNQTLRPNDTRGRDSPAGGNRRRRELPSSAPRRECGANDCAATRINQTKNTAMSIRIATRADIPELRIIRSSVTENILTSIITEEMIIEVMEVYGRIWIYEYEGRALGFSAADKRTSNIWALFLLPAWENRGIGKQLLDEAVEWL